MNDLLKKAIALLAQRDYSEWELRCKLSMQSSWKKGGYGNSPISSNNHIDVDLSKLTISNQQIDQVIDYCYQYNWLNDQRYAEQFIRNRSSKGYGPRRIMLELQQKGVAKHIINQALQNTNIEWRKLVESIIKKKFGDNANNDLKTKMKVINFLNYRGFESQLISSYFDNYYI